MTSRNRAAVDQASTGSEDVKERVTVNLTAKASDALAEAVRLTQNTKTDNINKALIVYAMLRQIQASGGVLYVKEPESDPELLELL
jgi:hypothetical protein